MSKKTSFLVYTDMKDSLSMLSDVEFRQIMMAMFEYTETGMEPELSGLFKAFWLSIKGRLDRDQEKYKATCERNRENIRKRWNKETNDTTEYDRIPSNTTVYECIPNDTKNTDNDNDNDNDIYNILRVPSS